MYQHQTDTSNDYDIKIIYFDIGFCLFVYYLFFDAVCIVCVFFLLVFYFFYIFLNSNISMTIEWNIYDITNNNESITFSNDVIL